jgi:hypothetical protein
VSERTCRLRSIRSRSRLSHDMHPPGETIAILRGDVACPVNALAEWLAAAAITEGPVFRPAASGRAAFPIEVLPTSLRRTPPARARPEGVRRPLATSRLPDLCSSARRKAVQDDGREPATAASKPYAATSAMPNYSRITLGRGCFSLDSLSTRSSATSAFFWPDKICRVITSLRLRCAVWGASDTAALARLLHRSAITAILRNWL